MMDCCQYFNQNGKTFFGTGASMRDTYPREGVPGIDMFDNHTLASTEGPGKEWSKKRRKKWEQWKRERRGK
jgi:hypothetical protein